MPEEQEEKKPEHVTLALLRLGSIQMHLKLVDLDGGIHSRPVAQIQKIVSPEELERDPDAGKTFEMEELAALEKLCKQACDHAYGSQTLVPRATPLEETPPLRIGEGDGEKE